MRRALSQPERLCFRFGSLDCDPAIGEGQRLAPTALPAVAFPGVSRLIAMSTARQPGAVALLALLPAAGLPDAATGGRGINATDLEVGLSCPCPNPGARVPGDSVPAGLCPRRSPRAPADPRPKTAPKIFRPPALRRDLAPGRGQGSGPLRRRSHHRHAPSRPVSIQDHLPRIGFRRTGISGKPRLGAAPGTGGIRAGPERPRPLPFVHGPSRTKTASTGVDPPSFFLIARRSAVALFHRNQPERG